ncbi:hypothetical protein ACM6Q7_16145 [Peribacillus butanolivorans]|uniref:hypothetical protein n=1 Tax=Peribacillus butanolivorans TaxID=421767 RepID=UPI0039FCB3BE
MIKDKKFIYFALIFLFVSMALNFPFPHESPYGETVAWVLNIPVESVNGLQYIGITSLIFLIMSLFFLVKSLEKYHGRFVVLAIMVAMFTPPFLASSFQKYFATGIYAISYERDISSCSFEMTNETTLHGECELPFENYSRDDAQFTIEFFDEHEDDVKTISLMNTDSPYEVSLSGKERKRVKIDTDIDVSQMESHIESGDLWNMNIIIKSGERIRKL